MEAEPATTRKRIREREEERNTLRKAAPIRKVHQDPTAPTEPPGSPRNSAELRDEGGPAVNHKRVARIMRTIELEGVRLRRRHPITVADQAAAKALPGGVAVLPALAGQGFRRRMGWCGRATAAPDAGTAGRPLRRAPRGTRRPSAAV
ncbi:transposase [Streptomyces sp. NPDC048383]|uniref:transposase n=1 Tax=Streptomyces sp. NPDC048383 TaxID=3155386 RepID=UPI00341E974C